MHQNLIVCPKCKQSFELTEAMAGPLIHEAKSAARCEVDLANKVAEQAKNELANEKAKLQKELAEFDSKVQAAAAARRPELEKQIRAQIEADSCADLKAKEERNIDLQKKLKEAKDAELAALKAQQKAEALVADAELEVTRQVTAKASEIREQAIKDAQDAEKQKLAEKDLLIQRLTDQAAELKRQAEVGSQQLQGDAAELDLKNALEASFRRDEIEEVKAGQRGADWLQHVYNESGQRVGTIVWESKNATVFQSEWLGKAKQNARKDKHDIVVIVSNSLPKGITHFDCCEDVWVVNPAYAIQLAKALRNDLISTAGARRAAEGRVTNAERVYDYLMGPEFVARIKGIAEPFIAMQSDLEAERRSMTKHWARRQKHIERVLDSAFGMRGDIEALAGQDMPELEAVTLKSLPSESEGGDE
jgi:hypothetical protein